MKGSRSYNVRIGLKSDGEIESLSCSCPYADGGQACKHMAAVFFAVEEKRKTGFEQLRIAVTEKQSTRSKGPTVNPEQPFEKMAANEEYTYFDLNYMLREAGVPEKIWVQGRRWAADAKVRLDRVDIGYASEYYGGELFGVARGIAYQNNREFGLTIYFDKDKITSASCMYPGCFSNYDAAYSSVYRSNKICIHEAALLYLLEDYLIAHNPGDATSLMANKLLSQYELRHANSVRADVAGERAVLHIEPRLEGITDMLNVSFRTGTDKLYVVKNLTQFVRQMENGEEAEFGTKTRIHFGSCTLDERSQVYFDFIRKAVNDEIRRHKRMNDRFHYYDENMLIKGDIPLTGAWLDEFYKIIQGQRIEYTGWENGAKKKTFVTCREGLPKMSLTLQDKVDERNIFQGIQVSGTMQRLQEGSEDCYFVDDTMTHLERIGKEAAGDLMPLYRLFSNGQIAFEVGRCCLSWIS